MAIIWYQPINGRSSVAVHASLFGVCTACRAGPEVRAQSQMARQSRSRRRGWIGKSALETYNDSTEDLFAVQCNSQSRAGPAGERNGSFFRDFGNETSSLAPPTRPTLEPLNKRHNSTRQLKVEAGASPSAYGMRELPSLFSVGCLLAASRRVLTHNSSTRLIDGSAILRWIG